MAIDEYRVLALIPARSGSKGLPDKNIKTLNGRPLLSYPIRAACRSKYVDQVLISTDSEKYADIAASHGAVFQGLRPERLASDSAKRSDVILHELSKNPGYDILLYLEPTSPLTTHTDIDHALEAYVANEHAKSLVSICFQHAFHPSYAVTMQDNALISPILHSDFDDLPINRQGLSDSYFFDGSLYISDIEYFKSKKEFLHNLTMGFQMPLEKAIEIDSEMDLKIAEMMLNEQ